MEQTETRQRDLPLWLGLTLILLGLLAGGWFIYWQVAGYIAGKPRIFTIPGVEPGQYTAVQPQRFPGNRNPGNRMPPSRVPAADDEIRSVSTDTWRVRAGALMLNIRKDAGTLNFQGSILNPSTFHPDYAMTLLAKTRLKAEQLTALGLSEEQITLLGQVQGSTVTYPANLDSADTAALSSLFTEWQAAADGDKPAKSAAVVSAARKIATQRTAAAKTVATAQVAAFRKTFSDDAWQKLREAALSKTATP